MWTGLSLLPHQKLPLPTPPWLLYHSRAHCLQGSPTPLWLARLGSSNPLFKGKQLASFMSVCSLSCSRQFHHSTKQASFSSRWAFGTWEASGLWIYPSGSPFSPSPSPPCGSWPPTSKPATPTARRSSVTSPGSSRYQINRPSLLLLPFPWCFVNGVAQVFGFHERPRLYLRRRLCPHLLPWPLRRSLALLRAGPGHAQKLNQLMHWGQSSWWLLWPKLTDLLQAVAYLMVTSGAAATEVVYLAYKGDERASWSEACSYYGEFCNKAKVSLSLHMVAFACYLSLSLVSAYRVFCKFEAPRPPPPPASSSNSKAGEEQAE